MFGKLYADDLHAVKQNLSVAAKTNFKDDVIVDGNVTAQGTFSANSAVITSDVTLSGNIKKTIGDNIYVSGSKFLLNTLIGNNISDLQDTKSFTSTFQYYEIIFDDLSPMENAAKLCAQFFISGNLATDSKYNSEIWGNDSGGNGPETLGPTNCFNIWGNHRGGPQANTGFYGKMTLFNPSIGSSYKSYIAELYAPLAYNNLGCQIYAGGPYLDSQNPVTGVQFYFNNGNIASGVIKIYGCN